MAIRGRILALLTTVAAALAVTATPASAAASFTVTPGDPADGVASPFVFKIGDLEIVCDSATIGVNFDAGTSPDNQIGTIGPLGFQNCVLAGFLAVGITKVGSWSLHALSYDPDIHVVMMSVEDFGVDISGAGCDFILSGPVDATFDNNDTSVLSFPGNPTLAVVDVGPAPDNCFDLVHEGGTAGVSADFLISPPQIITP